MALEEEDVYEEYAEGYSESEEDELFFDINELKEKNKTSFQSIINQKELASEELDQLFLDQE